MYIIIHIYILFIFIFLHKWIKASLDDDGGDLIKNY